MGDRTPRKRWFITGASRGFGRHWASAALARGDQVAAAVRNPAALADLVSKYPDALVPVQLDVTSRSACFKAVEAAQSRLGGIDVVINNAGYGHFGMIEELSEAEAREQMEANFFGALWVTQAALPHMRDAGQGTLIQVSSIGGLTSFPNVGMYHASKWALEGFSQSLAAEVRAFGIRVVILEPGPYNTDWAGASSTTSTALPSYDVVRERIREERAKRWRSVGDAASTAPVVLAIADHPDPPLRILLGDGPLDLIESEYDSRLMAWRAWRDSVDAVIPANLDVPSAAEEAKGG